MLIGGVAVGLLLGLLAGGRLDNLANIRLRFLPLLFLGVIVRFGTELGLLVRARPPSRTCASRCSPSPTGSCCSRSGRTASTRA